MENYLRHGMYEVSLEYMLGKEVLKTWCRSVKMIEELF